LNSISNKLNQQGEIVMQQCQSEVAYLLAQICAEYKAAERALHGYADGISRHSFITAKMERMGELHHELQGLVGDEAMRMVSKELSK
jgi:hypothetical protein